MICFFCLRIYIAGSKSYQLYAEDAPILFFLVGFICLQYTTISIGRTVQGRCSVLVRGSLGRMFRPQWHLPFEMVVYYRQYVCWNSGSRDTMAFERKPIVFLGLGPRLNAGRFFFISYRCFVYDNDGIQMFERASLFFVAHGARFL